MKRPFAHFFGFATPLLWLAATACATAAEPTFAGPVEAGLLAAPPRNEASGLAASRRLRDVLWVHDDSGGAATLYAVRKDGSLYGKLHLSGVRNVDWEDIAAFELGGKAWLIVGDIGDNDAKRHDIMLHVVEEPTPDQLRAGDELSRSPAGSLHLVYEDGPRDCEAIAVDVAGRAIYLLTKRDKPPRLYRLPLPSPPKSATVIARFVGPVPHLPKPSGPLKLLDGPRGHHRGYPCAMDFAADNSMAVVLTYGDVLIFPRRPGESWPEALSHQPASLGDHGLPQAEAACFSPDGTQIYIASETTRRLLRYDRR